MKKKQFDKEEYQSDVLDLLRKILDGLQLKNIDFDKKLEGQERINFLKFCDQTFQNPFFEQIIANVVYPSLMMAAKVAENYDIVTFNRSTANGASLVREFFQIRSKQYQIEYLTPKEQIDPQKSFEPVGPVGPPKFN